MMTQMKKTMIYALFALALLNGCSAGDKKQEASRDSDQPSTTITLTPSQYKSSDIRLGNLATATFTSSIQANGSLKALPQDRAEVTSPMGANIRRILVVEGQRVARGQVLALLSHPDLITLQSRYAQAKARLVYLATEYQRQKTLYKGKVGAGRDFQQVASEYRALESELRATGEQLRLLGISLSAVDQGRTVTAIAVRSPISGTVERVTAAMGQYADPQTVLFTVANTDRLYADVLVYERDLDRVKAGQRARIKLATAPALIGRVVSVGRTFDDSSKAVHVRIAIDGDKAGLVAGMYASASIATTPQTAFAVPDEGVAAADSRAYVFVYKPMHGNRIFEPREVKIGRKEGGMTEIVAGLHKGETMAVAGAYTLLSEWKKSEVGEE
jgi:cobalt-zinc-cadmium efflux system membrane fusion protein